MYLKRLNGEKIAEGKSLKEIVANNKADLWDADLWGADLRGVNLRGANLRGADLRDADLRGAERGDWKLKTTPIVITGLNYDILIFDEHMEIGCEKHSFEDWKKFKKTRITLMDSEAWEFWSTHKKSLLSMCDFKAKETK